MHARPSLAGPEGLRTWILVAIVLAAVALMAIAWDATDLGDGLVLGSGGSVSSVADTAQGRPDDFLFGSPQVRPAEPAR